MKIERLKIHDFKCFQDLSLAFSKPVNFIFGQNATGKSTIAQALELALTGKISDLAIVGIKSSLVRSDAERFSIEARVQNRGQTLELFHGSKKHHPEIAQVLKHIGADKKVLACLLDSSRFLSEHPNDQKQLLFDLLGLTVDETNLKQHLGNWLERHPEVLAKNWRPGGDLEELMSCLEGFPASLTEGYDLACEERKLVKRELKAFEDVSFNSLSQGASVETLTEQILQKEAELVDLHTRTGEIRGLAMGEEKSLEAVISGLSGQIHRLEEEIKAFDSAAKQAELDRLLSEKNGLDDDLSKLDEEMEAASGEILSLEVGAREKEALLARLKNFTGLCPLFKEDRYACQTKEVLAAVREQKVSADGSEKLQDLRDERQRVLGLIDQKQKLHISIEGGIASRRAGIARLRKSQKDLEDLKVKREKLEKIIQSLGSKNKGEIASLKERAKALESEIGVEKAQLELLSKAARKHALEEKLGKLEVLVHAFSPKGIMGDLLAAATSRLTEETNRIMGQLSGGEYAVEIIADTFDIYLVDLREKRKTLVPLASESERFRLGIVFQAVLAQLSGLKFMVIDGLDILDQHNRGFFFRFLQEESSRFDQIIVLCTIGQYQPKNPGLREIEFWVIDKGSARVIPVDKAA